jgi:sugar lactone lactonase YvrE
MSDKMRSAGWGPGLAVLVATSCGFPRLPDLAAGGGDGGGGDGATGDGGTLPVSLELLAGDIGGPGTADGAGSAVRFAGPTGVAVDLGGNRIYVADQQNFTIRKVTPAGIVATLAGTAGAFGSADGMGAAARFTAPDRVAVDRDGNLYVADSNNSIIRKITVAGLVTTLAGTANMIGSADGTGAAARFHHPTGVAVDPVGNVYVADTFNATIRKITAAGVVTTLAGTAGMFGSVDGTGAAARFNRPTSLAVDLTGSTVYVADERNHTIRQIIGDVVTTLAGTAGVPGATDGTGAAAQFNFPEGVAVDQAGNVYVADSLNATLRKVSAAGVVTTLAGTAGMTGSADGTGTAARFDQPTGVTVDLSGNLYVVDAAADTLRKVTPTGIVTTLAGAANLAGSADGAGAAARFNFAVGIAVDRAGNLYVVDSGNSTLRKITPEGSVTTLAGTPGMTGSADGSGAAARFKFPSGVAIDSAGTLYVTDGNNTIRKVTAAGVVTTLAGTAGTGGSADGTGAAASFNGPIGIAIDSAGNLYVVDSTNNTLRKVTAAGVVTTLAGTAGLAGSADGTGAAARFSFPTGVTIDGAGNLYVTDARNRTVRAITPTGVVTTLAGTAGMTGAADGTGAAARFVAPFAASVDGAGNVYVLDDTAVRKVTPAGTTTTVAGTPGVQGIVLGATPRFTFPQGLVILGDSLVVTDTNAILLLRHGAQ